MSTDLIEARPEAVLSLLIHGKSKVGKSTATFTAPRPLLALDAEGSTKFLPGKKVYWHIERGEQMPEFDGTWDICVVPVSIWSTVELVKGFLQQYPTNHPFRSVSLDSITEIQRRCKQDLKGSEAMKIQDWGVLLTRMEIVAREYRDLTNDFRNNVRCVVFVSESSESKSGQMVAHMQGQMKNTLPYWVDIYGYMKIGKLPDSNGQLTIKQRQLGIVSDENSEFAAGERVQGRLPDLIAEPNISLMMNAVFGENIYPPIEVR